MLHINKKKNSDPVELMYVSFILVKKLSNFDG